MDDDDVIAFSRFQLMRGSNALISNGGTVKLSARAFRILVMLLDANGRIVSVAAMRDAVWPGLAADTNAVQSQIAALRRALGDDRDLIETVPGRGYRFAGDTRTVPPGAPQQSTVAQQAVNTALLHALGRPADALPHEVTPFVGRHAEITELLARVPSRPLVTLAGAPGIGKTRLAIEAARALAPQFSNRIAFVPLAALTEPVHIAHAIAGALGYPLRDGVPEPVSLAAWAAGFRLLLVLDHADALRHAVATYADALTAAGADIHVLTTCRAPLGAIDEHTITVGPLRATAFNDDALALFNAALARRSTHKHGDALPLPRAPGRQSAERRAAERLCALLDGMPGPLELVAAAIAAGGDAITALTACAAGIDSHFAQRTGAPGLLPPQADIMRYSIEFVHAGLNGDARALLPRLGIFRDAFTEDAAIAIAGGVESSEPGAQASSEAIQRGLHALVRAGLVDAVQCDGEPRLRLPQPVRSYALEALASTDERAAVAARHAHGVAQALARRFGAGPLLAPLSVRHDIADVRAALDTALNAGRMKLAADLIDNSAPLWTRLALADEYVEWVRKAAANPQVALTYGTCGATRIAGALANALTYLPYAAGEAGEQWQRTYDIATACADHSSRLRALMHLFFRAHAHGQGKRARTLARKYAEIANTAHWPAAQCNTRLITGLMNAYAGELHVAIGLLKSVLPNDANAAVQRDARALATHHGLSLHLIASAVLSMTQWLVSGAPLKFEMTDLLADDEPIARCIALNYACAYSIVIGDVERADAFANALVDLAQLVAPRRWVTVGLDVQRWLLAQRGDSNTAKQLLDDIAPRIERHQATPIHLALVWSLISSVSFEHDAARADRLAHALIQGARRAQRTGERWMLPCLNYLQARLMRARGHSDNATRRLLVDAWQEACEQGASWLAELIAAELDALTSAWRHGM